MKSEIFECNCFYSSHMVKIVNFPEEKEVYLEFSVDTLGFWSRLMDSYKYLFGKDFYDGMFDCWILNNNDLERFKKTIGNREGFPTTILYKKIITIENKNYEIYHATCGFSNKEYYLEISYDPELNFMTIGISLSHSKSYLKQIGKAIKFLLNFNPKWVEWKLSNDDLQTLYTCVKMVKS